MNKGLNTSTSVHSATQLYKDLPLVLHYVASKKPGSEMFSPSQTDLVVQPGQGGLGRLSEALLPHWLGLPWVCN